MVADNINLTLKKLAKKAGVDKNVHNHSLRHMFATTMLDHRVPVENIQICLGHSDLSKTMRYAKISDARKVVEETMSIEVF